MTNNSNIVAGCASKSTTITSLLLHVRDDGSFWDRAEGEDVPDGKVCVLASVDELTSVHSLVRDEGLGVELESVWISELNFAKGRTTSRIVDDLLHDAADVTMTL